MKRIPNRRGAGDAFVLAHYAREVQYARSKRNENYALVVAIDGDRFKVRERLRQLEDRLADAGLSKREPTELIVICVPTWSIETWELWLCGHRDIDEDRDFKSVFYKAQRRGLASAKSAAKAWFTELTPEEQKTEQKIVPSLTAGRLEVKRLDCD